MEHLSALKNEQTARIVMRETALYVYIGTIFAVYAAEGQAGANQALVEIIRACSPALSAIMFSIYLSNDYYVSKIGAFVRLHADAGRFTEWERFHRRGVAYELQKALRTIIVVLLFAGWALYQSVPVFLSGQPLAKLAAAIFGALVLVELALFIALQAEPKTKAE